MHTPATLARRCLAALLLGLWTTAALTQTPSLYTVEVVVFRTAGTSSPLPAGTVLPMIGDDGIDATPARTAKLTTAARKLAAGEYTVLAHVAWTQGPTVWNSGRGVSARQLGMGNGVDGKVYLERSDTYPLNLGLDLTVEEGGLRYRIEEMRRGVKVDQIQYFDHPSIGVLAIVTRAGN